MTNQPNGSVPDTARSGSYDIVLDQVSKSYGRELPAVGTTSIRIKEGEFVCLVGPSGCGKTTLLRLVAGLTRPTTGTVTIGGDIVTQPRRDVGIAFQRPVLLPWKRVLDNVALPGRVAGSYDPAARSRAVNLLRMVGLGDYLKSYPGQLSGGMQHRVAICRALSMNPHILLMDEPFAALDAITREEMGIELLRIWESVGITVLFITHSISEAVFLSSRVIVMQTNPGRVVQELDVDLPRPRTLDTLSDSGLAQLSGRIRTLIEQR
jgi:NitT/TauT family transport system ATP-binding protein